MLNLQRLACIFAPNLPIQVEFARRGSAAQLIVPDMLGGDTVFAASGDIILTGVEIGMSLYQAKQIAPSAIMAGPNEVEYHQRHAAIHESLKIFSAAIETIALGEFLIDIRGLGSMHGNEETLAKMIYETVRSASQLAVRVGIGSGKFVAQQAARQTADNTALIVPARNERSFLSALPITTLPDMPGEMYRRLSLLDIYTLGDLSALSKPAVLRQFGGEASSLYELARGNDTRPLQPDVPPLRIVRSMTLVEPVSERQILLNVVNHLSQRLSRTLIVRGYHAEALKLTLEVGRKHPIRLEQGQALKPPTADEAKLGRLAMHILGQLGIVEPVARISLCAYPLRSWHHSAHQLALVKAGIPERQTRLEDVIQLILHRFGQAAIKIASLLGPPIPLKVNVKVNAAGWPSLVTLAGQVRGIVGIDEHWREERAWWAKPLRRDYYRVILADGSLRNLFQNLNDGDWFLDRAWPIR